MNINRNNYEEIFLLYADNELSQQERNMVELFVQQNADMQEEFLTLQQSVVKPDENIRLEDKSFLFREQQTFINQNNYEEIFVLYNDNELNEDERIQTQKYIEENPTLQSEFALLQRVKFEPDETIVFPAKISLHKKEDRIIPLVWRRMAAAAIFIGLGLWGGIAYFQKNKLEPPVALKKANVEQPKKIIPVPVKPKEQLPTEQQQNLVITNSDKTQNRKTQNQIIKNNSITPVLKRQLPNENPIVKNNQPQKSPGKNIEKIINKPVEQNNEDIVVKEAQKKIDDVVTPPTKNIEKPNTNDVAKVDNITYPASNNYAQNASYITEEKNDNYVFYNVSEEKFKKSKLFGFLKRVKRVIERKSPFSHNNDNKEVAAK